jgi:hypothetical protein
MTRRASAYATARIRGVTRPRSGASLRRNAATALFVANSPMTGPAPVVAVFGTSKVEGGADDRAQSRDVANEVAVIIVLLEGAVAEREIGRDPNRPIP